MELHLSCRRADDFLRDERVGLTRLFLLFPSAPGPPCSRKEESAPRKPRIYSASPITNQSHNAIQPRPSDDEGRG